MNARLFNIIRLIAALLTVAILLGQGFLPKKQIILYPNDSIVFELYSDVAIGGKSEVSWVSQQESHWRCVLREANVFPVCGASFIFSEKPYQPRDLSSYDTLHLTLEYAGPATKIRVYMRNHNPAYSSLFDIEAAKFQSIVIRISDLEQETAVQFREFSVADWWLDDFDIPRELAHPDFRSIVALGIDQAAPVAYGVHDYKLKEIKLSGVWVPPATLYLSIILVWMCILGSEAVAWFVYLYRRTKQDSKKLSQLRAESLKYQELSKKDSLTNIANRVGLNEIIEPLQKQPQGLHGLALMIMDIDHFKRINDSRGHDAGDRILQAFARKLSESIRAEDILARWGGEEFVILTRADELEPLRAFAEKIRTAIHVCVFEPDKPVKISVSIGVAMAQNNELFDDLFKRADECLYHAKGMGRNCVVSDADLEN